MNKKAVKIIGFLMIMTLASKLLGLAREIFLAGYYGAGVEAAAFSTAVDIPLKFFDLAFGAAVTSTFIPVFNKYLKDEDTEGGFLFASRFVNIVLLMTSALSILGMIFSEQLVMIFLPGGSEEVRQLASTLLTILFPTAAMAGLTFSMISILQSLQQFTVPAMISLFPNLLTIIYLLTMNKRFGIKGLAVAFLLAWIMQAAIQIPFIKKERFIYTPSFNFRDPGLKSVSKMALPIIFSSWVQPVSIFMLGAFASFMGDESLAAVKYANRIYIILAGIFVFAMMNYLFPMMSRQAGDVPSEEFKTTYKRAFESLCFFIIPLSVGAFILSSNLISVVYERGAFSREAARLTSGAFSGFALAIFGFSLFEVTSKAYYAMKKVAAPTVASAIAMAITFFLAYMAVFKLEAGLWSISLAFSIGITVAAIILLLLFNKKTGGILKGRSISEMLKALAASAVMGAVVMLFRNLIIDVSDAGFAGTLFLTTAAAAAGLVTYLILMALLKSPTFGYYYRWVKGRLKGGASIE